MLRLLKTSSYFLIISVFLVTSCKNKDDNDDDPTAGDNIPPVITLKGDSKVQLSKNATYVDLGATALDNVDGDITNRIQVINEVDNTTFGIYNVIYTVTDAAGNHAKPVVRNVEVVFGREDYLGDYDVKMEDGCGPGVQLNSPQEITEGTESNEIIFNDFLPLIGGDVPATISGFNINLKTTTLQTFFEISGSGFIDETGKTITLDVTINNTIPIVGGTETCRAFYTKK